MKAGASELHLFPDEVVGNLELLRSSDIENHRHESNASPSKARQLHVGKYDITSSAAAVRGPRAGAWTERRCDSAVLLFCRAGDEQPVKIGRIITQRKRSEHIQDLPTIPVSAALVELGAG